MRILMLNPFFFPYTGGTEKHLLEVSKRLARKHDVTVLTARLPNTEAQEEINGVCVVRTPARILENLPKPLPPPLPLMPKHKEELKRLIAENDVVHGHNRFVYGLSESALAKKMGRKMCWTLHNARPEGINFLTDVGGQAFDDLVGRRILKRCDGVLAVSKATMEATLPHDYAGARGIAYNGVDTKTFKPMNAKTMRERFGLRGKVVMTNCRLVEQKGIKYLIDAMRGIDAQLVVFGRGPLLEKLKKRAEGTDAVFIYEHLSDAELAALYAACDVFVLPSLWEPFGMVLAEAMACGKPVIGTRVGGIPEIVTKDCGFLAPPADSKALAERLLLLLGDNGLRKRMGSAGRRHVLREFTWEKTAAAYEKIYGEIS
ncbi:Trehalose synthase [Candidatus Norongarragalina meridionalis]|nr:Trehalose synthase [Candidatus Norongarragalina meridionalis]